MAISTAFGAGRLLAILGIGLGFAAAPPAAQADTARLTGGPAGVVKSQKGELLEGIMVQLIAKKNAVRTTVYSDAEGRYEFPALDAGSYTLRIARPREFQPFVKESVDIKGATALPDITLDYVTDQDTLPPVPQIAAQMTGSEWLLSLSGTGAREKAAHQQLQLVPFLPADISQSLRRGRLDQDRLSHDSRCRLAAHQHQPARPLGRRRGGQARQMASLGARTGVAKTRLS